MKKVLILRGLPGSGKTTFARNLTVASTIVSADDYYMVDGVYKFDAGKIQQAHNQCLRRYTTYLSSLLAQPGPMMLVVDNTNTTAVEIAPYYRLAQAFGWQVEIHLFDCDVATSVRRNVHGVPESVIYKMAANLQEKLPWPQTVHGMAA